MANIRLVNKFSDFNKQHTCVAYKVPDKVHNPFDTQKFQKAASGLSYTGIIASKGGWAVEAAPGWLVKTVSSGVKEVVHNLGQIDYTVNVSLYGIPGKVKLLETTENSFTIETKDNDNNLIDYDVVFTLSLISSLD